MVDPQLEDASYCAGVREDTLNEQIYCYYYRDSTERLIADFYLTPGDTISVHCFDQIVSFEPSFIFNMEVQALDSVLIGDEYIDALVFDYDEYWIEGAGSSFDLFFPGAGSRMITMEPPYLLCIHQDGDLIYDSPYFDSCYYEPKGDIINQNSIEFNLYSTIVSDFIHIELDDDILEYTYAIYSTDSTIVKRESLLNKRTISLGHLPKGIYLFCMYTKNGFAAKRIIKT